MGVLILAHGGTNQWNGMVRKAVRNADLDLPTEVAFGMGMHRHEVRYLQQAVNRLERKGLSRIVVVPLLVSSYSEVFRQYEYLFGLRKDAQWPEAGAPVALEVPITMGRALDDSPVVVDVLLDRARQLSRQPQQETVIIVAHGPNEEPDNHQWLAVMSRVAEQVRAEGGFREVKGFTMRDDAPVPIHDQATKDLREAVQRASEQGRVVVVPLLIARGGVERKIPKLLVGLTYTFDGHTLLPHPKMADWITQQVRQLTQASRKPADGDAAFADAGSR